MAKKGIIASICAPNIFGGVDFSKNEILFEKIKTKRKSSSYGRGSKNIKPNKLRIRNTKGHR